MPYPNEHSARLKNPKLFEASSFRKQTITEGVTGVFAKLKRDGKMTLQSVRFKKKAWSVGDAKKWLAKQGFRASVFEPATGAQKADLESLPAWRDIAQTEYFDPHKLDQLQKAFDDDDVLFKKLAEQFGLGIKDLVKLGFDPNKLDMIQWSEPKGYSLEAEIFASGVWKDAHGRTDKYTDEDLDEMVTAFEETKEELQPPLRLGDHDKGLAPAVGWVSSLQRKGGKLLATFTDLPEIVYKAIKAGRYKNVSSGIDWGRKFKGKQYGKMLNHVAILGANLPAVKGLADLQTYLGEPNLSRVYTVLENNSTSEEVVDMEEMKVLTDKLAELEGEVSEYRDRAESAEKNLEKVRDDQIQSQKASDAETVRGYCETAVKAGTMTPASRDLLVEALDAERNYSQEGEIQFPWETVRKFAEANGEVLPEGEQSNHIKEETPVENPGAELHKKTTEYCTANAGIEYADAMRIVQQANPELTTAWLRGGQS